MTPTSTTPSKPLSQQIEDIRQQMATVRSAIHDIMYGEHKGWKDRVDHVHGLLTCGIVTLASSNEEIIDFEIKQMDRERGPSLQFRPRGIGLDSVPACFVCGEPLHGYSPNIAAFVRSKEEGEEIVSWFKGRARLDYRPSEPNWIQVKLGCCDAHKPQLEQLYATTAQYGRIRQRDIEELMVP
jgi:hypothetical protein